MDADALQNATAVISLPTDASHNVAQPHLPAGTGKSAQGHVVPSATGHSGLPAYEERVPPNLERGTSSGHTKRTAETGGVYPQATASVGTDAAVAPRQCTTSAELARKRALARMAAKKKAAAATTTTVPHDGDGTHATQPGHGVAKYANQ